MTKHYYCYAGWAPGLWQRWLRRLARETRQGIWQITIPDPAIAPFLRHSLTRLSLRCQIHFISGDVLAFEYIA